MRTHREAALKLSAKRVSWITVAQAPRLRQLTCPPVPEQLELQQKQSSRSLHQPTTSYPDPIPSQASQSSPQTTPASRHLRLTACSSIPSSSYWEPRRQSARPIGNRSRVSVVHRRESHGHPPWPACRLCHVNWHKSHRDLFRRCTASALPPI